jgi:hypothetical protein
LNGRQAADGAWCFSRKHYWVVCGVSNNSAARDKRPYAIRVLSTRKMVTGRAAAGVGTTWDGPFYYGHGVRSFKLLYLHGGLLFAVGRRAPGELRRPKGPIYVRPNLIPGCATENSAVDPGSQAAALAAPALNKSPYQAIKNTAGALKAAHSASERQRHCGAGAQTPASAIETQFFCRSFCLLWRQSSEMFV